MTEIDTDKIITEGVKERLADIIENDIFHRYGTLIARNQAVFKLEYLDNLPLLLRKNPSLRKIDKSGLDW